MKSFIYLFHQSKILLVDLYFPLICNNIFQILLMLLGMDIKNLLFRFCLTLLMFSQRDSFKLIDNRPESTVLVTGQDVQALFNFLLNCRSCIANTGVQAGIPPTLLSPTSFKGATLRTLKVKN